MKKHYMAPSIICLGMETANMIAASADKDPNEVVDGGGGVNTGGYSQEGGGETGDGGTVGDMSKDHGWYYWDE